MEVYTWSFAQSFLVFLSIVFIAETLATQLKQYIPMPLLFGALFAAGFALGILPTDMLLSSNMVSVGTIAFNVLIIHSGTMINIRNLSRSKTETWISNLSALIMTAVLIPVLWLLVGRELALLSPGSVIGGGASCAIGSKWISDKIPDISFYPWIIFMFQGLFSVPIVNWALKKEVLRLSHQLPEIHISGKTDTPDRGNKLVDHIGQDYKTTAWYLGTIMVLAVLNNILQNTMLKGFGINPNITALFLGMLAGNLGLIDRAPLFQSDTYGLLILSLMSLMANNLAHTPLQVLFSLAGPALLALFIGSLILTLCGYFLGKQMGIGPYAGVVLTMNSVMGFPVNRFLATQAARTAPETMRPAVQKILLSRLNLSTSLISNGLSVIVIGILVALI